MSVAESEALFKDLKGHSEIPFDFPPDCCYARASAMAEILAAKGVEAKKVWTYGEKGANTLVPVVDGKPVVFPPGSTRPRDQVRWTYHIAPTIPVKGADGVVRDMVMDPSLADKPLTIDQWNDVMRGAGSTITETTQTGRDVFARVYDAKGDLHVLKEKDFNYKDDLKRHIADRDTALGR